MSAATRHICTAMLVLTMILPFSVASDSNHDGQVNPDQVPPTTTGPGPFMLECVVLSGGAAVLANGTTLNIAQQIVGTASNAGYTLELGIVSCLASASCVPRLFGDVAPPGVGNGIVNLDDILCVLGGFANASACPDADLMPCGGHSIVNLDDILAVLGAFSGNAACPDPCV